MVDWLTTIRIGDLHAALERGDLKITEVAEKLAKRVEKNRYAGQLAGVVSCLREVRTRNSYDLCLDAL